MIYYYRNPKTEALILFDADDNSMLVLERIKSVRVFVEKDLESPRQTAGTIDGADGREEEPTNFPVDVTMPKQKKVRRSRTAAISPSVVEKMRLLHAQGKTIGDIAEQMGLKYQAVYAMLRKYEALEAVGAAAEVESDGL